MTHFFTISDMPVSNAIREQIIALKKHTSQSDREISRNLSVDHRTVGRIWDLYQKTGSVEPYQDAKMGHSSKLTVREKAILVRECKKDLKATAEEVRLAAGPVGDKISTRTTRRILSEAGMKTYRAVKKPFLSAKHKSGRLRWAKLHQHWTIEDWKKVRNLCALFYMIFIKT